MEKILRDAGRQHTVSHAGREFVLEKKGGGA
jgi:hypothetical protein